MINKWKKRKDEEARIEELIKLREELTAEKVRRDEAESALVEIADIVAAQDDALVEIAELITE